LAWTIDFDASALKDLRRLGRSEQLPIERYLNERVATANSPRELGKALVGSRFGQLWRYRVGDYRIICQIKDNVLLVLVLEIGHRSVVYR
jgi:mRNA interferase RelE/StbE